MCFDDITVVVQGPVQALNGRTQEEGVTQKCLASIRNYLPGAKIILSTWKNQDLSELDYDELVISEDPGQNIRQYKKDGKPEYFNNNRQIVSTVEGLKKVKTKYAIKLRSDNYLVSNEFINLQKQFSKRCSEYLFLTERVVVCNAFTRKYTKGHKVAFHLSDFFYFGLTKDLLSLWHLPLIKNAKSEGNAQVGTCYPQYIIASEQLFCLTALEKFDSTMNLTHLLDNEKKKLKKSDVFYANNFVVVSAERLGLGVGKFANAKVRIARNRGLSSLLYFHEWQDLYKKYCDNSFKVDITFLQRCKLFLMRLYYVYPNYVETKIRLLKRKFK